MATSRSMLPTLPRWLRFRLSTVLILTAIAAWGMALRPTSAIYNRDRATTTKHNAGIGFSIEWEPRALHFRTTFAANPTSVVYSRLLVVGPIALIWPVLALVFFLTWKSGWAI